LLAEQEGVGAKILVGLGLAKDKVEDWMLAQIPKDQIPKTSDPEDTAAAGTR
jgi:hypothetical protein